MPNQSPLKLHQLIMKLDPFLPFRSVNICKDFIKYPKVQLTENTTDGSTISNVNQLKGFR